MSEIDLEIISKMVNILKPLSSEERQRVIQTCSLILNDNGVGTLPLSGKDNNEETPSTNKRTNLWLKQNSLSFLDLEKVFFVSDTGVDMIAQNIPGRTGEKVKNVYVLYGIAALLKSGDQKFDDEGARKLCGLVGCFDSVNHATYSKKNSFFVGSKKEGWTLTGLGLKRGADLVKELIKEK